MRVGIIGQGYVGQTLAVGAASSGLEVVGLDSDIRVVNDLLNLKSTVPGVDSQILKSLHEKNNYYPTSNPELLKDCEVIVIAVPTPVDQFRKPDMTFIAEACKSIYNYAKLPALIINESTSYPGTLREFIKPLIENNSNIKFEYAVAPERVDPGNIKWSLVNTPRIVAGLTELATHGALNFYSHFCERIYKVSSPEVAELAKLLENTFRQVNIALINEVAEIANSISISTNEVVEAADTKPFGFMKFYPGLGVGGHCIPVDPVFLTSFAEKLGVETKLINTANNINLTRPEQIINNIEKFLGLSVSGLRIQIAGITYKVGVSDIRESPALKLMTMLSAKGAEVSWHDPLVKFYENKTSQDLDKTIDLGIIVTPHQEIDFSPWENLNLKIVNLSVGKNNLIWPKFL